MIDILLARYMPGQQGCIMNNSFDMLSQMVGNTPLIKLRKLSEITGCSIYGKANL